jgi:hypothetical protein
MRFDADAARVLTEMRKISAAQRNLNKSIDATSKAAARGSEKAAAALDKQHAESARLLRGKEALRQKYRQLTGEQERAFGPAGLGKLASYAGGFLSIQAAVSKSIGLLRTLDAEREAAAGKFREAEEGGLGSLVSLGGGDKDRTKQLVDLALQIRREGGASSLDEAGRLAFELASGGIENEARTFSALKGIDDNVELAGAASLLRKGTGEKDSARNLLSQAFKAAESDVRVSGSDILTGASRTVGFAKEFSGIDATDLVSAVGQVAGKTGSGAVAATQVQQLLAFALKKINEGKDPDADPDKPTLGADVQGLSLSGIVEAIEADEALVRELASGRKEAFLGFQGLRDQKAFAASRSQLQQAAEGDFVGGLLAARDGQEILATQREARIAEGAREVSEAGLATEQAGTNADINRTRTIARKAGHSEAIGLITEQTQKATRLLGGDVGDPEKVGHTPALAPRGMLKLIDPLVPFDLRKLTEAEPSDVGGPRGRGGGRVAGEARDLDARNARNARNAEEEPRGRGGGRDQAADAVREQTRQMKQRQNLRPRAGA